MRTAQDFISLTSKIQMDLRAAEAKITELRAWLAALPLPTEEHPISEATLLILARNTRHEYTEGSLRDELALKGADPEMVERIMAKCAG